MFYLYYKYMSIEQAIASIQRCEAELQAVLKDAADKGDYAAVIRIGELARSLAVLADGSRCPAAPAEPTGTDGESGNTEPKAHPDRSSRELAKGRAHRGKKKRVRRKKEYPKFARSGDQLIKVGWSKRDKREYRHRAPRHVAVLLASRLASKYGRGVPLSTDDLFPLVDDDGAEVPTYQSYLCLAWFRHEELVSQEGRQGYHVPSAGTLCDVVKARWEALPNG